MGKNKILEFIERHIKTLSIQLHQYFLIPEDGKISKKESEKTHQHLP